MLHQLILLKYCAQGNQTSGGGKIQQPSISSNSPLN